MSLVAAVLLCAGAGLLLVAAWGVWVLPDALSRQHAATKAGTFALAVVVLGAMVAAPEPGWLIRLGAILVLVLSTLPVAAHMLARAAVREAGDEEALAAARRVDETPDTPSVAKPVAPSAE